MTNIALQNNFAARRSAERVCLALVIGLAVGQLRAANQTPDVSPVQLNGPSPFKISVQPYDFGAADLPTLHSFAAGEYNGKWVLIAGRTNGLHGFGPLNSNNFAPESQNRQVWVIDPVTKQSWSRSLDDAAAGLTNAEVNSLTPANTEFYQRGNRLYMVGGYGVQTAAGVTPALNSTFNTLSAIDLPGLVAWTQGGAGTAKASIRQITDPSLAVTGGDIFEIAGRTHLVFGQNFQGNYGPGSNGIYTDQVRSFDIVDDGINLSLANPTQTPDVAAYRRRDLDIVPVIKPGPGGQLNQGLVALSGVFTPSNGAWTVPVEIDANGNPTMADPNDPATFKQGMNGYHSAKVGLFSESTGQMHELLFGGISYQYYEAATQQFLTDPNLPFVNDITDLSIDATDHYTENRIGEFPVINDGSGNRLRFGANAEFFPVPGLDAYSNNVLKLDSITGPTTIGYIFGGLASNAPNTRGVAGAASIASNMIFAVVVRPVPEPTAWGLLIVGIATAGAFRAWKSRRFPSDRTSRQKQVSNVAASSPILRRPRRSCTLIANCSSGEKKMRRCHSIVACLVCVGAMLVASASRAVVAHDEAASGDLSNDRSQPTLVPLALGTNSVVASMAQFDEGMDLDYMRINLPAGTTLTAILLEKFDGPNETGFIGVQAGTTVNVDPD